MDPQFPIDIMHSYHSEERQLFSRMVFTLGVDPSCSMKIIAFWLWLEENGHSDILRRINSFSDDMVLTIASIGQKFIEALYHDEPLPNPDDLSFEPTPSICFREKAFRGINYFLNNVCHKIFDDHQARAEMDSSTHQLETLVHQMSHTYIDGKNLERSNPTNNKLGQSSSTFRGNSFTTTRTSNPQLFVPYGEGTSTNANRITSHNLIDPNLVEVKHAIESIYPSGALLGNVGFSQPRNSNIDVSIFRPYFSNNVVSPSNQQPIPIDHLTFGANFSPQYYMAIFKRNLDITAQKLPRARCDIPRDERTLFLTFSNGYPFTEDELYTFFMRNFGDVELVTVEEPNEDRHPLYAHVSFYSLQTLFRVLNGNARVKFFENGKHLWARRYIPRRR